MIVNGLRANRENKEHLLPFVYKAGTVSSCILYFMTIMRFFNVIQSIISVLHTAKSDEANSGRAHRRCVVFDVYSSTSSLHRFLHFPPGGPHPQLGDC